MKVSWFILLLLFLLASCKDRYNPPVTSPPTGYLVVEGFINNGIDPTVIKLSRSTLLDTSYVIYESGARVMIESNNNESFSLHEAANGVYTSDSLLLNKNNQYRLHIFTADGSEYVSDFTETRYTPPVDSLNWVRDANGVHFFINAHDDLHNTKYYQWEYGETWEFHSGYHTSLTYIVTHLPDASEYYEVGNRFPDGSIDTSIYKCWHSPHSTSIILGSTEKLSSDRIFYPLLDIEAGAQQLSVLYRLILTQHAVSKSCYDFLSKMKKNTEQLGTIFDAQPSDLTGNIHCVNHPSEFVVGYMEVSQLQTKTVFISNSEVPDWGYRPYCFTAEISLVSDSIKAYGLSKIPLFIGQNTYTAANETCVDCTLTGSNIRPPDWP